MTLRTHASRARRLTMAATASAAALVLVAAPALATVAVSDDDIRTLSLVGDNDADTFGFSCAGGSVTPDDGTPLACSALARVEVLTGGGEDTISFASVDAATFPALRRVLIDTDDGDNSTVIGSQVRDVVVAGPNDSVGSGGGDDLIQGAGSAAGGAGEDVLVRIAQSVDGGAGDDFIVDAQQGPFAGGPGYDTLEARTFMSIPVELQSLTLRITSTRLEQSIAGSPSLSISSTGIEAYHLVLPSDVPTESIDSRSYTGRVVVVGLDGRDVLTTGPGPDELSSGSGGDVVNPGGGADVVRAGSGDDTLSVRDGRADRVDCGEGVDTVTADRVDVLTGCEAVSLPAPVTSRISGPTSIVKGKAGFFRFTSDARGATYQCQVDARAYRGCSSPFRLTTGALAKGRHTLRVRAAQPRTNVDRTPSSKVFRVV